MSYRPGRCSSVDKSTQQLDLQRGSSHLRRHLPVMVLSQCEREIPTHTSRKAKATDNAVPMMVGSAGGKLSSDSCQSEHNRITDVLSRQLLSDERQPRKEAIPTVKPKQTIWELSHTRHSKAIAASTGTTQTLAKPTTQIKVANDNNYQ